MDARHRVERVGEDGGPRLEGGDGHRGVRIRVADGSGRTRGHDLPDRVEPAGQLRRDRDLADGAASGIEQEGDIRLRRVTQQRRFVRAVVPGVEERALEVRTQDVRIRLGEIGDERDTAARDSRGAVTSEMTARVVPCARCISRPVRIASTPSSNAAPAPPWPWMSTNPGVSRAPGPARATAIDDLIRRGPLRSRPAAGDDAVLDADPAVLDDVAAVDDPCGVDD